MSIVFDTKNQAFYGPSTRTCAYPHTRQGLRQFGQRTQFIGREWQAAKGFFDRRQAIQADAAYRAGRVAHDQALEDVVYLFQRHPHAQGLVAVQLGAAAYFRQAARRQSDGVDFAAGYVVGVWSGLLGGRGSRQAKHSQRSEEHTSELQSLMRISYA